MPFDAAEIDVTTTLLLELRGRLTPENWRPYPCETPEFVNGRGCLIQQLWHVLGGGVYTRKYGKALSRLRDAVGVHYASDVGKFNDSHTLEEVQAVVDIAIAGK